MKVELHNEQRKGRKTRSRLELAFQRLSLLMGAAWVGLCGIDVAQGVAINYWGNVVRLALSIPLAIIIGLVFAKIYKKRKS